MIKKVPLSELNARMNKFKAKMNEENPDWEFALIISKVNQYYFTGTRQDGILLIPRDGDPSYRVRRSYERATDESLFPNIGPMESYRDAMEENPVPFPETVYIETDIVPVSLFHRLQKYFPYKNVKSLDSQVNDIRSIKSEYELNLMRKSGGIHQRVLEELVPGILKEGMSEAELAVELYALMVKEGHHGTARFGMFDSDLVLGHVAFGESSVYPTSFDGPGGNYGLSPAVPFLGSRENKLKPNSLVFLDVACGYEGYHSDKTMTYMFGKTLSSEVITQHQKCLGLQNRMAEMLKPGVKPSDIYNEIMNGLDEDFLKNFMGYGNRRAKFLGHGIGLFIDEMPVIADRFNKPLEKNMVIALEPKKGVEGYGMVGVENTFIVTESGGELITGNNPGLIPV